MKGLLIKGLREGLGRIMVFADWLTRPRPMQRSSDAQQQVEQQLSGLALYQLYACPFCIKTRRTLHRLNLPMALRSTKVGSPYREQLATEGGKLVVPCLRIEEGNQVRWMYESSEIIAYLEQRFGAA
ncbi:glutathione S-transferase N-terminal domain-containing protein [Ferrimonas senticii]|uniref:glutathione S-transferase N-terminal domain-containing protein n=1 Tax=Ferrimonas senticii TaxID=394566 RepID=UPI0004174478|nr:glutathione S-transferase N-terminal domain-containing protein [Ferrimonas senticii]